MGKYQAYPEYKDSEAEWIGAIPSHWKMASLSKLFSIKAGGDVKTEFFSEEKNKEHPYPIYTNANDEKATYGYTSKSNYPSNTITVSGRGEVGFAAYRDHAYEAIIRLLVLTPMGDSHGRFFTYFINEVIDFRVESSAIGQLSTQQIAPYKTSFPSYEEQQKIANFLDHETAKIDILIAKQQQLITLLKEKRQSVISHAVTKGLNPNAPMRDSGVEWLGEVPVHWDVRRINLLFSESSARASTGEELDYPVLSVSIHHGISDKELNEAELNRKIQRSEDRSLYKVVHNNVLAYNMMRAWQGGFGASKLSGLVSPAYVVCRPKTSLDSQYFELVLRTSKAVTELKRFSRGITDFRLRLYWDEFKNIKVPVPPEGEIRAILKHISDINSAYDNLGTVAEQQIKLLQERRTALISAAVTGKIDVRNWKAT